MSRTWVTGPGERPTTLYIYCRTCLKGEPYMHRRPGWRVLGPAPKCSDGRADDLCPDCPAPIVDLAALRKAAYVELAPGDVWRAKRAATSRVVALVADDAVWWFQMRPGARVKSEPLLDFRLWVVKSRAAKVAPGAE